MTTPIPTTCTHPWASVILISDRPTCIYPHDTEADAIADLDIAAEDDSFDGGEVLLTAQALAQYPDAIFCGIAD